MVLNSPTIFGRFYSSPSCDGDQCNTASVYLFSVSILPRLATGIKKGYNYYLIQCFYSSPSCDGDRRKKLIHQIRIVSILPRLATGISADIDTESFFGFLFFPVLRRGSEIPEDKLVFIGFLFFPVLRRGSQMRQYTEEEISFYSSPSCDGDLRNRGGMT